VQQRVVEKTVPNGTYAFAASANEAYEFQKDGHGLFTNYLLKGLNGEADVDDDGKMSAKELQEYISFQIPNAFRKRNNESERNNKSETSEELTRGIGGEIISIDSPSQKAGQIPVSVFKGPEDAAIWGEKADYGRIVALIIGVDNYLDSRITKLRYPVIDARSISEVIKKDKRAAVQLLTNPTRVGVLEALHKLKENIKPDDLLIMYFSGHGVLGRDGFGKWLLADSIYESESTYISSTIIKSFFDEIPAKTKTLYIDACFSGADKIFTQPK
jgi:hypothetical protein